MAHDLFSKQSKAYATFRPTYPEALYDFVFRHLSGRATAWDCATGNGQVARRLCTLFNRVEATDISAAQIAEAFKADNIFYSVCAAEQTKFPDGHFDLITVGQALHWINTDRFYEEVRRTSKAGALLAVWGYSLLTVNTEIDKHFVHFYKEIVGPYWDAARKHVEEEYRSIPFPFPEIPSPKFSIDVVWTREQFAGYLQSWSATQAFIKDQHSDPVPAFIQSLEHLWRSDESKPVSFPVFLRLGRIQ